MTTLWSCEVKCACCGLEQTISVLGSTNELRPGDLDMRPGEMRRSTMEYWVQQCAGCGFVSSTLAESTETDREIVRSSAYVAELKSQARPPLANLFVCRAILDGVGGDLVGAGKCRLYAAWVCDDAERMDQARLQRLASLELFERARAAGRTITEDALGGDEMLLTDLARRVGEFERARRYCEAGLALPAMPEFVQKILEFERALVLARDTACHSVGEVEKTFEKTVH